MTNPDCQLGGLLHNYCNESQIAQIGTPFGKLVVYQSAIILAEPKSVPTISASISAVPTILAVPVRVRPAVAVAVAVAVAIAIATRDVGSATIAAVTAITAPVRVR